MFEVEKILKKRRHPTKGVLYFVKWRHFPASDNTWEPACNFTQDLIDDFESTQKSKKQKLTHSKSPTTPTKALTSASSGQQPTPSSSNSSSSITSRTSRDYNTSSSHQDPTTTRPSSVNPESRISRKIRRDQRRQQQVKLQLHIQQQQQKLQAPVNRQQLAVFNPNGTHRLPVVEEVVYEPNLTKEPIIVTDVTSKNSTVTISECKTPEGFFSVTIDTRDKSL